MRRLVVLGAGTAGTVVANKLRRRLDRAQWGITVVDRDDVHHYQPGYLFLPFGRYRPDDVLRSRHAYIPDGVELVLAAVDRVAPESNSVLLADGRTLGYDYLVVATGVQPRPDQTPGLLGGEWRRSIHDFYTYDGALALARALAGFTGGRLVINVVDMPIKCPVAPLEFAFLADAFLGERGLRDRVELTYVTPLPGAFTKPVASAHLGGMLEARRIGLETDFLLERVRDRTLVSYDQREVPFDLLVTVPLNMGADYVARSGLGDEMNYVPVDRRTLRSTAHANIFAVGDANDLPTSKAGSVAHFSADVVVENMLSAIRGLPLRASFDGTPTASSSPGTARACSSTSTTTLSRCRGSTRCRASVRSACSPRPGSTTSASSGSAGRTGTCCCPAGRCRCRRGCPWPARSATPCPCRPRGGDSPPCPSPPSTAVGCRSTRGAS